MPEKLGKKYRCFGEYKCPHCGRQWQSARAWADYGQQCQNCATNANAFNLQRLFVYICSKCDAKWKWAYVEQGMKCRKCPSLTRIRPLDPTDDQGREYIRAHRLRELSDVKDDGNHIDPEKEHRQDLCEKCRRLGRPCCETAGHEYTTASTEYRPRKLLSSIPVQQFVPEGSYRSDDSSYISSLKSSERPSTRYPSAHESNLSNGVVIVAIIISFIFGFFAFYFGKN